MASLNITHFWSNLLAWGYQHIFQFDGTIEWKVTEQSEGASKVTEQSEGVSKATEQSEERQKRLSKAREHHMHWNLIVSTTSGCTR